MLKTSSKTLLPEERTKCRELSIEKLMGIENQTKHEKETTISSAPMSSTSMKVQVFRRDNSQLKTDFVVGKYTVSLKEEERQPVLVYSRVMGYHRPVQGWNIGKKQEFVDRKYFKIKETVNGDSSVSNSVR